MTLNPMAYRGFSIDALIHEETVAIFELLVDIPRACFPFRISQAILTSFDQRKMSTLELLKRIIMVMHRYKEDFDEEDTHIVQR
jgi:hypothetical protein